MDLSNYLVLGIIIACNCLGYVLKNASVFKQLNTNDIPVILLLFGGFLGLIYGVTNHSDLINGFIVGCVSGLASVGTYESFVRSLTRANEINIEDKERELEGGEEK